MNKFEDIYDVIVIGAGHAGIEAALVTSKMGFKTLLATMNLESVAYMACNPNIGGTAKGHIVREIDALGGQMAINIDKTYIQSRMLNTSKGPAVHSLRAQADKNKYSQEMKKAIENQENLYLKQIEIVKIERDENGITGAVTRSNSLIETKCIILATGTYLNSRIITGDMSFNSGPNGFFSSNFLSQNLKNLGIKLKRFKTGTPARIHKRSVNFEKMEIQLGDEKVIPFSFLNTDITKKQEPCYLTYTNENTHKVIRENIHRSPMYNGSIEGIGPRYCPSIEDKIMRFKDKLRHQIFIEPEGINTDEMYVQGMSSSLPEDVQLKMLRTIEGLENVEVMRYAYAIEYDVIDSTQLNLNLEFKEIPGLFSAGQINGSSGYEEAAGQGILAGINAGLKLKNKEPFILNRSDAYIGVLVDDLVTKGTNEPYRMMTSRAEYRLTLRQDNADIRLTKKSNKNGIASDDRINNLKEKYKLVEDEVQRIKSFKIQPNEETNIILRKIGTTDINDGISMYELLKRPQVTYENIKSLDKKRGDLRRDVIEQVEISIKYEGYIKKQEDHIKQFLKLDKKNIPRDIEYLSIENLRLEARQKLDNIKPLNIGQASRISGVSPADITVLLIYLEQKYNEARNKDV